MSFIRCQLQPSLPLENSEVSLLTRTAVSYQTTGAGLEEKICVVMLRAGVMIDLVSMSSASLGKGHFFALVQADLISIFFPVSSVHGKKKAQRSERLGRRARAPIPCCADPA